LDAAMIYYNKTMFEDAGVTDPYTLYKQGKWDYATFRKTAKDMSKDTNKDGKTDVFGFHFVFRDIFVTANGNRQVKVNDNGTVDITMNQPSAYAGWQLYQNMQLVDKSMDWQNDGPALFMGGRLAMLMERPWNVVGFYKMYDKKNFPDELGMVPPPKGPDTGSTYYAPSIMSTYSIPTHAKNPLGASAWMYFGETYKKEHYNDADAAKQRRITISDEHMKIYNEFLGKAVVINTLVNGIGDWSTARWPMEAEMIRDNVPPATAIPKHMNVLKDEINKVLNSGGAIND